jgi:molecular chaperone DnaJ
MYLRSHCCNYPAELSAMLRKNYYLTLGILPNESAEGIRQAFHEIVKRYHPDRVGSARLHFFQEIVEAYRVLADPERRRDYDRGLFHAGVRTSVPQAPVRADAGGELPLAIPVLRTVSIKDAPFEAALARVSGSLTAAEVMSKQYCEGLDTAVILSVSEAKQGGLIMLAVPSCSPCERCGGSGREGMFPCHLCDGEGLVEEKEWVRAHVVPMVGDGTVMSLPLRGLGVHNFYLRVHIRVVFPVSREAPAFMSTETPGFD